MRTFITEAGFGIIPVFVFGATMLGASVWHAIAPAARRHSLLMGFGTVTLLAGVLGTVVGLQKSVGPIMGLANPDRWIFLIGLKESLNCMVAALIICTVAGLFATYGSFRSSRVADRRAAELGAHLAS